MKSISAWFCSSLIPYIVVLILPVVSILFSGCYTLKQGTTLLCYLNRAIPLEKLSKGDKASVEDKLFVQRVEDIRHFAMEELGLKKSKNYTRYVELDRDYLAAVVSASPKDSFGRYEWWFPIVGKLPYKGFFDTDDAWRERARLDRKDLDVWVRGVDAFSTLGWFRDPLYSYMKSYSDMSLAALIIHELLHSTVFLKNHAQFSEELAEFVGTEGARLYIEKYGNQSIGNTGEERADRAAYIFFIQGLVSELDAVYKSGISREEKLARKEEIIKAAKARFDENYDSLFSSDSYRFFTGMSVNNAYLELYRLYHEEERYFRKLYESSGSDLRQFITAAKTLNKKPSKRDPREAFEEALALK